MHTDAQIAVGHKANINNTNTSEESKQHSREVLDAGDFSSANTSDADKNPNNVAGGLKATINNPNNSKEAKQSARDRLEGV